MKRSNMLMLAALLMAASLPAPHAADKPLSSKERLREMIAQLQNNPDDDALREKIIKLARKVKPPTPDSIVDFEGRAEAAVKSAKNPADFADAAEEYEKTLLAAPWIAREYYNLGLVLEKAGDPAKAMRNLKLYLIASPQAKDAVAVRKKIAGFQFEIEKGAKQKAAEREHAAADSSLASKMEGIWHQPAIDATGPSGNHVQMVAGLRIKLRADGNKLHADCIGVPWTDAQFTRSWYASPRGIPVTYFEGTLHGGRLTGTINQIAYGSDGADLIKSDPLDVQILMNADGQSFIWKTDKEETWNKE